jgi:hypothetical protein
MKNSVIGHAFDEQMTFWRALERMLGDIYHSRQAWCSVTSIESQMSFQEQ